MIQITAQLENDLADLAGKQLPFVTSLALNRTTVEARDLVRGNLPKRFKLRNNWTKNGIQAQTSNKNSLVARVMAPGYMGIQETGGTRTPERSKLLAAPSKAIQGNRVPPKSKRPKALLSDRAFIIDMKNGDAGVFMRYGKKRGQIKLLWWLTDDQQYDERFEFERDVNDYVQDRFSANFLAAMTEALGRGEYAQSAKRGRKRIDRPEGMSARAFKRQQSRA